MMMKFNYPEGATPLEPEEIAYLIPAHITTHEQLNAWEQKNIISAEKWARVKKDIISVHFFQALHKQMFNETWKWAGTFRHSGKNIGVDWYTIPVELKKLCDDVLYQLFNKSFSHDEIAVRLHHRLVWIHAFPNGNGRHARLVADLLIMQFGYARFSWGINQDLYKATSIRNQYIYALRLADQGDYSAIIVFARS